MFYEVLFLCVYKRGTSPRGFDRDAAIMAETPWPCPLSPVPTVPLPLPPPDWDDAWVYEWSVNEVIEL